MDELFCFLISIFGSVEVSSSPPPGGACFAVPPGTSGENGGEFSIIPVNFKFVLFPNFVIEPKYSCGLSIEELCGDQDSVQEVMIPPCFIFIIFMLKNLRNFDSVPELVLVLSMSCRVLSINVINATGDLKMPVILEFNTSLSKRRCPETT